MRLRARRAALRAGCAAGLLLGCAAPRSAGPARVPVTGAAPPEVSAPLPHHVDALAPGPSLDERLEEIRRRVQDALDYPDLARRRGSHGEVLVGFEIGPDRSARAIRVERSSGSPSLDRAAERAVLRAAPLPFVYGRVEVPVRFELDRE